jgi:hypothetical protein
MLARLSDQVLAITSNDTIPPAPENNEGAKRLTVVAALLIFVSVG